jgi:hypothetical protein
MAPGDQFCGACGAPAPPRTPTSHVPGSSNDAGRIGRRRVVAVGAAAAVVAALALVGVVINGSGDASSCDDAWSTLDPAAQSATTRSQFTNVCESLEATSDAPSSVATSELETTTTVDQYYVPPADEQVAPTVDDTLGEDDAGAASASSDAPSDDYAVNSEATDEYTMPAPPETLPPLPDEPPTTDPPPPLPYAWSGTHAQDWVDDQAATLQSRFGDSYGWADCHVAAQLVEAATYPCDAYALDATPLGTFSLTVVPPPTEQPYDDPTYQIS